VRALWAREVELRAADELRESGERTRVSIVDGVIRMPRAFGADTGQDGVALYRAAAAHASAHLAYSTHRFPLGRLRPVQVALVSLIEDARVEHLAWREMPGLRTLWRRFHVACPRPMPDVVSLLARLARALIDPDYEDADPWVAKGRRLFEGRGGELTDPSLSRAIGMLLGNDLGQMRIPFNAKMFVVEPAYRDDNRFLWDFGDPGNASAAERDVITLAVDLRARGTSGSAENTPARRATMPLDAVEARSPSTSDEAPTRIRRYPEWDYVIGLSRQDWCTIREVRAAPGALDEIVDILAPRRDLLDRLTHLVKASHVARAARLRRQIEGHDLDLDACIASAMDVRAGRAPSLRVYQRRGRRRRDLAILWLLDLSHSTNDHVPRAGTSVVALAREATVLAAEAMAAGGDAFAIHGFHSSGRHDVEYQRFKDFEEPYGEPARARLAGMRGRRSTTPLASERARSIAGVALHVPVSGS